MPEKNNENVMSYLSHEDGSCELTAQPQEVRSWRADVPPMAGGIGNLNLPTGTLIAAVYACGDARVRAMDMNTRRDYSAFITAGTFLPVKLNISAEAPRIGGSAVVLYVKPHIYKDGEYFGDFDKIEQKSS